ncbi:MAG: DUF4097 family beta strand repeat-containing protein [Phycisphaerales bacterium]|jgi:hypothetical protein|nr:DUF4097 family beta strand repeat-containing protein [Phycisphaerales bacterium]
MKKLCFIAILTLIGCQTTQVVNFKTTTLNTSGPIAVDVSSFGGNVTVIADPTVLQTTVSAKQLELGLGEVPMPDLHMECSTYIEPTPWGEIIHVDATTNDNPLGTITADITVRANSIHGVTVETKNGDVTLLGITGELNIQTSDGDVRIVTPRVMNEDVLIENIRGDIVYRVRAESSGTIDATAMNGEASLDLRYGEATILPGSTGDHLVANFNNGVNSLVMRTVDGNIRIFVVADPVGSEPWISTEWLTW